MATYRPFAYNTGSTIDGTEQVGDLAIGYPTYGFESTGIRWYNGPDEDLGYIIGFPQSGGTQPLPVSGTGYVQFWRSKQCTASSFVNLTNSVIKNPTFNDPTTAKNYLNSAGYWTNFQTGQSLLLDSGNVNSYPGTGTTWFDLSVNNNNGTLINGVSYSGSYGGILNFNPASSQYVSFSSPSGIPITGSQYTINTWFRANSMGDYGIVGWGNWGSYNQVNALRLYNNGFVNYWWANDLIVPYNYNTGQWYNLSVTYDGTYRTMYLDGVQIGQDSPGTPNVSSSSNLAVGTTNGSEYFNGDIAIVDIYPFAQNICEITNNYTSLLPRFLNLITPTPTNTSTPTPSITSTQTPTITPTNTPSITATNTETPTPTLTQTPTNTPSITASNTPTNTETPTNTPTSTQTNTPSTTPSTTPTNTPSITASNTPTNTETPTNTPTPTQSGVPTTPTNTPTNTATPTNTPTNTVTQTQTRTQTPTLTTTQTPTPTKTIGGSILFVANNSNSLSVTGSTAWAVGTGDFTVEGWFYQTNNGNTNYLFSLGNANTMAVSVGSGGNKLQGHMGGSRISNANITTSTSVWYHWAVTRSSGTYNTYFNGTRVDTIANSTNITDSTSLFYVGYDGANTSSYWPGNMTNFRFVKGSAVYTGTTYTVPTSPLTPISGTQLLLGAKSSGTFTDDSSGTGKSVTNNGTTYSALTPF